jgi:hypothetical protein
VVVDNLHAVGVSFPPNKTDAPLIIDANVVLPFAIAVERLKVIAGRRSQVAEFHGSMQLPQLPLGDSLDGAPSPDGSTPV